MRRAMAWLLFCSAMVLHAQFTDSFTDNDLNQNPPWVYTAGDFTNSSGVLKTSNTQTGPLKFGISTKSGPVVCEQYSFEFNMGFNPSSQNYFDYFLFSDTHVQLAKNGYFVRAGNTKDEISLYVLQNGVAKELISGADGELNKSSNHYEVRVLRTITGEWTLMRKNMNGGNFVTEGTATDTSYKSAAWTGILVNQYGTSAQGKIQFDNVYSGPEIKDRAAPVMTSLRIRFPDQCVVRFNEPVYNILPSQFLLNNAVVPVIAEPDATDPQQAILTFASLPKNSLCTLYNEGTADIWGNLSSRHFLSVFSNWADTPGTGELIITEIMANPPGGGILPAIEYTEIQNRGSRKINLGGCTFSDVGTTATLPDTLLNPGEYIILTSTAGSALSAYGKCLALTRFPGLNNDGDELVLRNPAGLLLHAVHYTSQWHSEPFKKNGGWSLELKDSATYCIDVGNWGSNGTHGGTPGTRNSLYGTKTEFKKPRIVRAFMRTEHILELDANQPLDSVWAADSAKYLIAETGERASAFLGMNATHTRLSLYFQSSFPQNSAFHLHPLILRTCDGRLLTGNIPAFGLPEMSMTKGEIHINEILFNPKGHDHDYLEIVNSGNHILDMAQLRLANTDDSGKIKDFVSPAPDGYSLLPGEYMVWTTDEDKIKVSYPKHNAEAIFTLPALPGFPNDRGTSILALPSGFILDSFSYSEKMHAEILSDVEGVSLEKLWPAAASGVAENWTSAASVAGFGTPGLPNSQMQTFHQTRYIFRTESRTFSPDNDGIDDVCIIHYSLDKPGYIATIRIFAENGAEVATPWKQVQLESSGTLVWNGTSENGTLPAGNYMISAEAFHTSGDHKRMKCTITLLSR
ncbi:MAG: lamin tail domain-containing protein [Bacteroidetes bacterium]|nr:lamin tail domain-containing protein [Bacteroidota bacterium]